MPHSANSPSRSNEITPNLQLRVRKSCDACQEAKIKCSQKKPACGRCERQGQPCTYSPQRRIGRPRKRASPVSLGNSGLSAMVEASSGSGSGAGVNGASPEAEGERGDNEEQRDGDISILDVPTQAYSDSSETQFQDLFAGCSPDFAAASLLHPDLFYDASFSASTSGPPTSTVGPDTQSILFGDSLSAPLAVPSGENCGAKCYTALLLQLLHLHKSLPETAQPGIDTVLLAEREMRTHQRHIFACTACASDRSSLLLLATIAERIVQTLHLILEKESLRDAQHSGSSRPGSCGRGGSHSDPSSRRASVFSFSASPVDQRAGGGGGCYICPLPLQVGSVKVEDYSKKLFLKSLLRLRLTRLAHVLCELQNASATRPSDCLYFASELFLGQSLQRVEYLRGQIQVWDC